MAFGVDLLEVFFSFIQLRFGDLLYVAFNNLFWVFGVLAFIVFLFPKDPSWKTLLIEKIFFWGGNMYALVLFFLLFQIPLPFAALIFIVNIVLETFLVGTKLEKHILTFLLTTLIGLSIVMTYL